MDKQPDQMPIWERLLVFIDKVGLRERKKIIAVAAAAVAIFATLFVWFKISSTGYMVSINDTDIGMVKDKNIALEVLDQLNREIMEQDENEELVLTAELIVEKIKIDDNVLLDRESLKQELRRNIELRRKAITLCVDSIPLLSIKGLDKAENLLERVKEAFRPQNEEVTLNNISIKEKVELVDAPVEPEDIMDPEDAYKFLLNGTTETKVYTVEEGDSLWAISQNNNISVEDLERANPDVDPKRLQIGQQLSMIVPKPFVTVVTEEIVTMEENIPFETEYSESSEFYKGESIVKVSGKHGEREITASIIRENGIETARDILDETIIKEPVTRQVALGTKQPPPRQGTGTFAYPARGSITSGFGWRWGRRHNGIDIGVPEGTPVKAADGGTVKFSGRMGNYGNLVIIDHGGGFETYYGHNSKNLVSKGEKVFKGQTIAMSGSTGRVTGPHLHFEVRKFGVPTNPTNYLQN